ncbi:MAG: hypothetical protein A7316_05875 [Candidatus Altiarchaeales archaeon WOR_SM1_86-2]|nr:MAG: hypothetical protein A7316_05875 [Candidatus Altiarchaeales archaeon WOR_SM1_86-2]
MKLDDIICNKRAEVDELKKTLALNELKKKCNLMPKPRDFKIAVKRTNGIRIIAEIKKKSPSTGIIPGIDPFKIAKEYEISEASSISVLTDKKYFLGDVKMIPKIKEITKKPILRKDFIINEYQVYESRFYEADAILLIASILTNGELKKLVNLSMELGMECLVECHEKEDIDRVPENVDIYGINNRDLKEIHKKPALNVTENLIKYIPKNKIIVSESGIRDIRDIRILENLGRIDAVLTGTSILRFQGDRVSFVNELSSAKPIVERFNYNTLRIENVIA